MQFDVNITAYNYSNTVNNLIEQIRTVFPNAFIRVWDNSPTPLNIIGANEIRWNRFNPSLSRVWNWAIAQSQTEWVMVTNDDIDLKPGWDIQLNKEIESGVFWVGPSRCFLFNKKLLDVVGWFDERMNGNCYEDLDYIRRMNFHQAKISYGKSSNFSNYAVSLKEKVNRENRVANNQEYFKKKYSCDNTEIFQDKPLFETEDFYPCRPR